MTFYAIVYEPYGNKELELIPIDSKDWLSAKDRLDNLVTSWEEFLLLDSSQFDQLKRQMEALGNAHTQRD